MSVPGLRSSVHFFLSWIFLLCFSGTREGLGRSGYKAEECLVKGEMGGVWVMGEGRTGSQSGLRKSCLKKIENLIFLSFLKLL